MAECALPVAKPNRMERDVARGVIDQRLRVDLLPTLLFLKKAGLLRLLLGWIELASVNFWLRRAFPQVARLPSFGYRRPTIEKAGREFRSRG